MSTRMLTRRFAPHFPIFVLVLLLLPAPLHAREAEPLHFLPAGSVDVASVVPPPPAVGSAEFEEEMAVVLWLQRTRTPEQVEFVRKTLDVERFAPLLGGTLVEVDGIELKRTIDAAIDDVRAAYDAIKADYDLPRPFVLDKDVHPVGDARPVASYPSGHATRAIVYARLLGEIFPERRDALLDLAHQIGYGRVIAGVHYPADVLAGQRLAPSLRRRDRQAAGFPRGRRTHPRHPLAGAGGEERAA
ncbi:MAG: phosphatase PAP2 family protein [Rhodospirillales bacterium]|nr:phosphatase PAP2 family protein [Rhodospirillales bacterium]